MQAKVFVGPVGNIEEQINNFLQETNANVRNIAQSIHQESPMDQILTVTIIYE